MTNSEDSDQIASEEAISSGSTLFANVGVVVNSRIRVKIFHINKLHKQLIEKHMQEKVRITTTDVSFISNID